MTAADRLAEIKVRADAATDGPWTWASHRTVDGDEWAVFDPHGWALASNRDGWTPDAVFIASARADVPALVKALQVVLQRHRRREAYDGNLDYCEVCVDTYGADWPCPEVRAINAALGVER